MADSQYQKLLNLWVVLGGEMPDRTGPEWSWRSGPSFDWLKQHLPYAPYPPE